jgi:hypothetical protein
MKLEKILEECKKRYPVGTTYKCVADEYYEYTVKTQSFSINTLHSFDQIHGEMGKGVLWENGKFAEIISSPKTENMVTITREQLKEIHDIACDTWKTKIEKIARNQPFGDIELSETKVQEMRDAATGAQKPTIEKIFGVDHPFKVDVWKNKVTRSDGNVGELFSTERFEGVLSPSLNFPGWIMVSSKFDIKISNSDGIKYIEIIEKK